MNARSSCSTELYSPRVTVQSGHREARLIRFPLRLRRSRPWVRWGLLLAFVAGSRQVSGGGPPTVRLISGEKLIWAYRHVPSDEPAQYRNFAYRRNVPLDRGIFVPVPIPPLRGEAVLHATVGDNLHVFFADGTHRTYLPIDMNWNDQAARLQIPQQSLPDNFVPLAIGGNSYNGVLFAVVEIAIAAEIQAAQFNETLASAEREGNSATTPPAAPAPLPGTGYAVVRYEGTKWIVDRLIPEGLLQAGRTLHVMAHDETLHIIQASFETPQGVTHHISAGRDPQWAESITVPMQPGDTVLNAGLFASNPYLLLGSRRADGVTLAVTRFADGVWQPKVALREADGSAAIFRDGVSAAPLGEFIVCAVCDEGGELETGFWSINSGENLAAMQQASLFNRKWRARGHHTLGFVIQYGLLGAMLAALFLVRKERFVRSVPAPTTYTLARFDARLKAFLIDLAVLAPAWLPLVTVVWFWEGQGLTLAERLALKNDFQMQNVFSTWVAVGCIVAVYGMIFESVQRTTLGKRLVGLKVVGEDDGKCRLRSIVLRNLLRAIEFQFPPLAVLILLTPHRQRVGDLFARTIVVESRATPIAEPESIDTSA